MGFLSPYLTAIKLGGLALAFLAVAGYVAYAHHLKTRVATLTAENGTLTTQLGEATRLAADNADQVKAAEADRDRQLEAVRAAHAAELKRLASTQAIRKELSDAPSTDARPLGPAALRALDRLRQRQAPGADPAGRRAGDPPAR